MTSQEYSFSEFCKKLLEADFMPHGHCFFWRTDLLWLHVGSDVVTTLAYYAIPLILVYFARKRNDIPFNWMFFMFGAFIVACGTTHLLGIITIWNGAYRIEGVVKLITALLSIATAGCLIPLVPRALSLPSQAALNKKYKTSLVALEKTNFELEKFNNAAIGREERIIELKNEVNQLRAQLGENARYSNYDR